MLKVRNLSLVVCTAFALLAVGAVNATAHLSKGTALYPPRPAASQNESVAGGQDCITQNSDPNSVTAGPFNIACPTPPTQWLRRFFLSTDHGLSGNVNVQSVEIGVQQSTAGQPATINLYCIAHGATFTYANMTLAGTVDFSIGAQSQTLLSNDVCGTCNADTDDLVVEVIGQQSGFNFVMGANGAGESQPSFIASTACGLGDPSPYSAVGFPGIDLVMSVCFGPPCGGGPVPALGPLGALLMIVALGGGSAFIARRRQVTAA